MGLISENYQRTFEIYENMLHTKSQDKEDWFNLGLSFFKLGDYYKAIECYNNAVNINSLNIEIWYNIGLAYLELGEHQKAIDFFEKVVEIHPRGKKAWHSMILTFIKLHDYERANKCSRVMKALEVKLKKSVKSILKKIIMAEPGIKRVILTDHSGHVISHMSKFNFTPVKTFNEIGATSSAVFYAIKELGQIVQLNGPNIMLAEFNDGKVYYCPIGSNKVLTIIGDKDVCLGIIRLIMMSVGSELNRIFMEFLNLK